jgi:hypothetical protein
VSCCWSVRFTETAVAGVTRYRLSVRWPWLHVDPQAENTGGTARAFPTPAAREWEIFRTKPAEAALKPGDTCLVGFAAALVHVQAVRRFDPSLVTGMLPRPMSYAGVLQQG